MKNKAPIPKEIYLCSDCRELFSVAFGLAKADGERKAVPKKDGQKCENCGGTFAVMLCRISKKKKVPTG